MRRLSLSVMMLIIMTMMALVAPVSAQDQSIVDIAVGNEDFSTLVAAIQNADPAVLETLSGEGPFTVFAPTNDAFNNLLASLEMSAEDLLAQTDLLTTVLLYHVVDGAVLAEDVIGLDGQSAPTLLEGASIGIEVVDGGVVLNGIVNVIQTDIIASNGVIHVIDEVLLPQSVLDSLGAMDSMEEDDMMMAEDYVNIRVAHFSPDTPAVDIYVNGEAAITELSYPNVTDFVTLPAGTYELAVAPAGTSIEDAAIGPAEFDLPADAYITVAAVGSLEAGTLTVSVIVEDFSELAADTAHVVVVHAIEGAPAVDVLAGGQAIVSDLAFPGTFVTASGAPNDGAFELDVPSGSYDLSVVASPDNSVQILDLSGTVLEAGSYYLVAAVGTPDAPEVALTVIDAMTAADLSAALEDGGMMMEDDSMDSMDMGTIVDIASADENFSTLVSAVVAADLAETLSGEGPFTVFAPTNDAFDAAFAALGITAEDLLADTDTLTNILLYHVVSGEVLAADVVGLTSATTVQGSDITISVVDGNVFLNDTVQVIMTDIIASNGVIHVIDGVLLPPAEE
ncbi:MAG: fasciclin domain-containing protein [Aggregatilineales bacterium]